MAKRITRQVLNKDVPEEGIYYNLKFQSNFDVLVTMRIGDRQIQRKKKNIAFIGEARNARDRFRSELTQIKAELNRGDIFWSQALAQYFKHLDSLLKTNEMSVSTYETRKSTLEKHTKSWMGEKLSDLHQEFIRQSLNQQFDTQSIETRKNVLKFVKQVFNYQISLGNRTLRFNPTVGIRYKKQFHKKPETISKVDIEKIIEYTHEIESEWASIFFLAYELGARSGELYALKWSDVDWINKNITISKSYCWKSKLEKEPKNSKDRTLPLNPSTFNYLVELKENTTSDYILPQLPAWQKGQAAKILRSLQEKLKIQKTNFHSIRSTFITQLLLKDVPPIKVMALAGHQDFKTTMIYVRSVAKELKGTTDTLDYSIRPIKKTEMKKSA